MVADFGLFQGNGGAAGADVLMRGEMDVSDFFEEDKENNVEAPLLQLRSALPIGYQRSPLQDITAILSCPNPNEDECGRHRELWQHRSQQKPLVLPCPPFVDVVTNLQISPLGQECSGKAGPYGSMDSVTGELPQHLTTSNEMTEESRKTMVSRLTTEHKSEKQLTSDNLIAGCLYEAKKVQLVVMASNCSSDAESASPSNQKMKRRKPFVKLMPGQSVPRFRYPLKTSLCDVSCSMGCELFRARCVCA